MVTPDPNRVHVFKTARAFEAWMRKHHDKEPEVFLRVYKTKSGVPSITIGDALDVVLCWGLIDGLRKSFDEHSYLQRYTPRRKQSPWSQINRDHVARLITAERMTEHGLREIERAKADGRWDRAYAPGRDTEVPADLVQAIKANARALATFKTLNRQNQFGLAFRLGQLKTEAGRTKKIAAFVEMLAQGKLLHPQRTHSPAGEGTSEARGLRRVKRSRAK
ncbi:MAG TPA: YdeI/OmpD-associated family protein [Polyangiales bacterium]|nr:YdeI/OmpD-associated family protein [Polyangiales bacterium]